jgi:hypothetical protein
MLNTTQNNIVNAFMGLLDFMGIAAQDLFAISVLCSMPFIVFAVIKAMNEGGGASIIGALGMKLFGILGCMAVVQSWPALARGVSADIQNFAQNVAGHNPLMPAVDFTPDGVIVANYLVVGKLYSNGWGSPFEVLQVMNIWRLVSIGLQECAGAVAAMELLLANCSMAIVLGCVSFLIGTLYSPFFSYFADALVRLIGSTAIFIVATAAFVAVELYIAAIALDSPGLHIAPGAPVSGVDMLTIPLTCLLFAALGAIVPVVLASRISGGSPLVHLQNLVGLARSFRF